MFVNRKREISILNSYLDMILRGQKINLSIFGQRRIGKTELLLKFKELSKDRAIISYLNMERTLPQAENFILNIVGELTREILDEKIDIKWTSLLVESARIGESTQRSMAALIDSMENASPDILLERGFDLIGKICEDTDHPIILIVDEFQEVQLIHERILHMIRSNTEKMELFNLWVAGSVFSFFEDLFESDNPFFGQFERLELPGFERSATYDLVDELLPFTVDNEHRNLVFRATGGQPYYITAVCRRFQILADMMDSIDQEILRTAIVREVFDKTGSINLHLEYLLNVSISRLRNKGVHHIILKHLSEKEDNLTGISSKLGKPTGEVSNLLKTLVRTDLVTREGNIYRISDPLMGTWLSSRYDHSVDPLDIGPRKKVVYDLLERICSISTELGRAKEIELKELLSRKFDRKFEPYTNQDGSIELDLVSGEGSTMIIEIKWRTRPMNISSVRRIIEKVKRSIFEDPEIVIVSRGGFDRRAREYSCKRGITCLNGKLEDIC